MDATRRRARYVVLVQQQAEMIDRLLTSRALLAHYRGSEIHNELLHDESVAFGTDVKFPDSDHAPVIAAFELPDSSLRVCDGEHICASSARRVNRACFALRKIIRTEVEYGCGFPENGFSIA